MSITQASFIRLAPLQLLMVFVLCGMMVVTGAPSASAQLCDPSTGCFPLKVYNCTGIEYIIEFLVCCDHTSMVSPPFPIAPQSMPPFCEEIWYAPPPTCTAIGVVSITPPPPGGFVLDITTCSLFLN